MESTSKPDTRTFLVKECFTSISRRTWLRYVGTEVYVNGLDDEVSVKQIVDCVGVDKKQEYTYGIEAKVSRADFNNGYCTRCNYNYVICPNGLIDKEELPDYVGLIYVDVENIEFITNAREHRLQGVTLIKKAKFHVNRMYLNSDGTYDEDMMFAYSQRIVEAINRSNLNELIYHMNYVPLAKVVKGRRRWR